MSAHDTRLWQAVLSISLLDAARGTDEGWINSQDFRTVCDLAGFNPEAVRRSFEPRRLQKKIRA